MEFLKALRRPAIGQRHGFADVSRPMSVKEGGQAALADLERQIPQTGFNVVNRPTLGHRLSDRIDDLGDEFLGQFHLENTEGFRNVHDKASLRVSSFVSCKPIRWGAFWLHSTNCNLPGIHDLRKSGAAVAPNRFRVLYSVDVEHREVLILAVGVKDRNRLMIGGEEVKL